MKRMILCAVGAVMIGLSTPALAEDLISEKDVGGKFSANVGLVSEYMFRALSQSGNGTPAIQGGFDFNHDSGVYVGVWGSNIDFGGNIETDFYAGWSGDVGGKDGVGLDAGVILYHYPGADSGDNLDYVEGYVGVSKDFKVAGAGLKASYSPDYTASSGDGLYLEGNVDVPAGKYFTVNLHAGRQWVDDNTAFGFDDYTDWLLGVSFSLFGFDAQVAYIDNDLDDSVCVGGCDRVIASLSRSF